MPSGQVNRKTIALVLALRAWRDVFSQQRGGGRGRKGGEEEGGGGEGGGGGGGGGVPRRFFARLAYSSLGSWLRHSAQPAGLSFSRASW